MFWNRKTLNAMKKIALILFFSLASYPLSNYINNSYSKDILQVKNAILKLQKERVEALKIIFLNNLRLSEGLDTLAYDDTIGQNTIGYGHCNREKLQRITVLQADSILFSDFEFALNYAKKQTSLNCECSLVLANFIFAHGIGTFDKSKIYTQKLYLNSHSLLQELQTYQRTPAARKARKFDKIIIEHCKH
jgi:GH24 family phage-related lysozyme (muramidase)